MKYPMSHWKNVAELYGSHLTVEEIQNRYPHVTIATIKRWLRRCREMGLIY